MFLLYHLPDIVLSSKPKCPSCPPSKICDYHWGRHCIQPIGGSSCSHSPWANDDTVSVISFLYFRQDQLSTLQWLLSWPCQSIWPSELSNWPLDCIGKCCPSHWRVHFIHWRSILDGLPFDSPFDLFPRDERHALQSMTTVGICYFGLCPTKNHIACLHSCAISWQDV